MAHNNTPLISIITPVYNGERYISECIQSVLKQTYENWTYVIVNNCSKDRTLAICASFAQKDSRIKIIDSDIFLDIIPNWNRAIDFIDSKSKYFKIIHADDIINPDFLEKTISLAVSNSSVGIVGSYTLIGNDVKCTGLPYSHNVVSGKSICRATLKKEYFLFGSPSSLLFRTDTIKLRNPFYDKTFFHADTELCYFILQNYDFGFIHQVLSYTRIHQESQTELFGNKYGTNLLEYIGMLKLYGPIYLEKNEFPAYLKYRTKIFYRFLARNAIRKTGRAFLKYHKDGLEKLGLPFNLTLFLFSLFYVMLDIVLNPKRSFTRLLKKAKLDDQVNDNLQSK